MENKGSLQWTAKVSKENLKQLIHGFEDILALERQNDPEKPDCPDFEHFGASVPRCRICPNFNECQQYTTVMRQHRIDESSNTALRKRLAEKNPLGGDISQNSRGVLLCYIVLHLLHPDDSGYIRNVSFSRLADLTSLAVSTVRRCMQKLKDDGYIAYGNDRYDIDYGYYDFLIIDYPKTFYTAQMGGKGFIHINNITWESLRSLSVNSLRVTLLTLCDTDRPGNEDGRVEINYHRYAKYLPGYFCRTVFDHLLKSFNINDHSLFQASIGCGSAILSYRTGMDARKDYQNSRLQITTDIDNYCQEVDTCMENLKFNSILSPLAQRIRSLCGRDFDYEKLMPGKALIKDMASICMDYTVDIVKKAYLSYICKGGSVRNIKNAGKQIRQICSGICGPVPLLDTI